MTAWTLALLGELRVSEPSPGYRKGRTERPGGKVRFLIRKKKDEAFSMPRGDRIKSNRHSWGRSRPWGDRKNDCSRKLRHTVNQRLETQAGTGICPYTTVNLQYESTHVGLMHP